LLTSCHKVDRLLRSRCQWPQAQGFSEASPATRRRQPVPPWKRRDIRYVCV